MRDRVSSLGWGGSHPRVGYLALDIPQSRVGIGLKIGGHGIGTKSKVGKAPRSLCRYKARWHNG